MTPQPSMKRGRQSLNQVSTELGEGHYLFHQNIGYMAFNAAYPRLNSHLLLWYTIIGLLGAAYAVHIIVEKEVLIADEEGY